MPQPTPRHFRIELGFDRQSDRILGTREGSNLHPLQNALIDVSAGDRPGQAQPAWYTKIRERDTVFIRLLDITDLAHGTCGTSAYSPSAALDNLVVTTTQPRNRLEVVPVLTQEAHWSQKFAICEWSPVFSMRDQRFTGYDLYPNPGNEEPGVIRDLPAGTTMLTAEFSIAITLEDCPGKTFVFDPEMIVGPQGTGG